MCNGTPIFSLSSVCDITTDAHLFYRLYRFYHRFDIGINFSKQKRLYKRTWSIGAYNVYNRNNPFFLYLDNVPRTDGDGFRTALKQVSLFPIIPYFNWSFEF